MPSAPVIVISNFQGEQPRIIPRLMPETAAQSAFDVRLDDGGLTPFKESVYRAAATTRTWQTIYKYLDQWIGWNYEVDAVPAPVAEDRVYYTGTGRPEMLIGTSIKKLAVPRPLAKPGVAYGAGTATGTDISTRQYIYTFVTEIPTPGGIQEESEPSPVSDPIDWKLGQTIALSNLGQPSDTSRGVEYRRIYRLQTGTAGTYFYFIADISLVGSTFTDDVPYDAAAEPCPSIAYNAPPDTLVGLTAMPNGMMAAFDGKKLYFSEPYKPHAWPEKYMLTLDYEIVALGAMGLTLLVTTVGQPYLVSGSRPDSMAAQKLEMNLPCIGKRSLVDLGYAIAYASNEGLVVARADGSVSMATANIFNRHDWFALNPQSMLGAQYNGRYAAFYSTVLKDGTESKGLLLIDLSGQSFLIRSHTAAQAAVYDVHESALIYIPPGTDQIRQLDAPGALPKYLQWTSKEFVLPYPESYGAVLIDGIANPETSSPDVIQRQVTAIKEANRLAMEARYPIQSGQTRGQLKSLGGELNGTLDYTMMTTDVAITAAGSRKAAVRNGEIVGGMNSTTVDGDYLGKMPRGAVVVGPEGDSTAVTGQAEVTVSIYADKSLSPIAIVRKINEPVRLPSGFKARTWEIAVYTNARIFRVTLAKTMDDLKRQP